jgi:hypothetical protein
MQPGGRLRRCDVCVVGADNLALESVMGEGAYVTAEKPPPSVLAAVNRIPAEAVSKHR